jgi:CheY-like chemotaxis protein
MPPGHRAKVLVVEDDAALRTLFLALLKRDGFEVECVDNGAEALDRLSRVRYSVVLLDLMMPVTSGFDVLRIFAEKRPELLGRTIVATGASERDLAKIDRDSVYAVLRKPFDIHCLVSTIAACANQKGPILAPMPFDDRYEDADDVDTDLEGSVRKFASALPDLRKLLASPAISEGELMLRDELRRVVGKVGGALSAAASIEHDTGRADRYEELGRTASRIASSQRRRRHDH